MKEIRIVQHPAGFKLMTFSLSKVCSTAVLQMQHQHFLNKSFPWFNRYSLSCQFNRVDILSYLISSNVKSVEAYSPTEIEDTGSIPGKSRTFFFFSYRYTYTRDVGFCSRTLLFHSLYKLKRNSSFLLFLLLNSKASCAKSTNISVHDVLALLFDGDQVIRTKLVLCVSQQR